MKLTIGDLLAHSFCPWYREQSEVSAIKPDSASMLSGNLGTVLQHAFVRELETNKKTAWSSWSSKWLRTFWRERELENEIEQAKNDGCITLLKDLYAWYSNTEGKTALVNFEFSLNTNTGDSSTKLQHSVLSSLPVIQAVDDDTVDLIFWDVSSDPNEFRRDLYMRTGALAVSRMLPDLEIRAIRGLSLNTTRYKFKEHVLYPNADFHQNTWDSLLGLVYSISNGVSYPNRYACKQCSLIRRCNK